MGMGLEWRWDREPLCWHTGLEVRTGSITPSAPTWEPGRREEPPPPLRWHRGGGTVTPPGCRAALSAATASAAALHEAPLPAPTAAGGGSEAERGHARSTAQTCSQEGLLPTAPARRGRAVPQPPDEGRRVAVVATEHGTAVGTQTGLAPVQHTEQRLHPNTVP